MQTNRTTIVIILSIYLMSIFFLLGAMSETLTIDYTSTSQNVGIPITFLGMDISLGESFIGNIVISIATLPLWFNAIFIVLPATLLAVFFILMFIPTIPSG